MSWDKDAVLDFLNREAPGAPMGKCMSLANEVQSMKTDLLFLKEMMAILSKLLLDDNGTPLKQYDDVRPAIKEALRQVSHCHSWVVCGPVGDAMEKLMKHVEEKVKK